MPNIIGSGKIRRILTLEEVMKTPEEIELSKRQAEERARKETERKEEIKPYSSFPSVEESKVTSNQDSWTITGVNYRDRIITVNLLKSLLDNQTSKTQDQWQEYSKQAKARNDFYVGDFPLYHSLFRTLFLKRDSQEKQQIEEARAFLEKQFKEKGLMTLTRITYNTSRQDVITHNYKMPDQYEIHDNFTGPNEYVKDSQTPQNYNFLLGSNNIQEIDQIYKWITKVPAYLWRLNLKPKNIEKRVARFYTDSCRAGLGCFWGPGYSYPALGVRSVCEANATQ